MECKEFKSGTFASSYKQSISVNDRLAMKQLNLLLQFVFICQLSSQSFDESKSVNVISSDDIIVIDGALDEAVWSKAIPASNFWQYFPTDSVQAQAQTDIYFATNGANLYVGIRCYSEGNRWLVNSLKRDFRAGGNDNITLVFDSFDDNTNGLFFGINPEGVIREGVITNGGNGFRDFSESWDNKWRGQAKKYDDFYTAELEIPFSTLRYDANNTKWGFVAYRFDTQSNEISVWNRVPRNQTMFSLAFAGDLIWDQPLDEKSSNISIIPFASTGITKDFEEGTPSASNADFGGDMKIGITSGLNLDLTANPDFSQVEVDRQITNLDRFEIFFPERRQFFLENADLFGSFGFSNINPFFSRRIGTGEDVNIESTVQNRILGGLRLSGKLDKNTRIGLLNMQTAESLEQGLPGLNFSVGVIQRKILKRSNLGFIFINKQAFGENVEAYDLPKSNRVAGMDFNYANDDNTLSGKTFIHSSFSPDLSAKFAHGTQLKYNKRSIGVEWQHEVVSDAYNAEVGFIRRTNYINISPEIEFKFYPQNDFINDFDLRGEGNFFFRPGFGKTDHNISMGISGQLSSTGRFGIFLSHNFVHLFDDFDPTGTDSSPLLENTSYNYLNLRASLSTDSRKKVSAQFRPFVGEYFNGFRTGLSGDLTFRYQPRGSVNLSYSWNLFKMPHIEGARQTFLIGPRIDYTFSKRLFATAFIQYNTQSRNTNINTRLQWRFAPVSDFFLVFTDNYFTGNPEDPSDRFSINLRNRAIVAKLTYWINV